MPQPSNGARRRANQLPLGEFFKNDLLPMIIAVEPEVDRGKLFTAIEYFGTFLGREPDLSDVTPRRIKAFESWCDRKRFFALKGFESRHCLVAIRHFALAFVKREIQQYANHFGRAGTRAEIRRLSAAGA